MKRIVLLLAASIAMIYPAEARHRPFVQTLDPGCNVIFPCDVQEFSPRALKFTNVRFGTPVKMAAPHVRARPVSNYGAPSPFTSQVLPHPAGCPHRAFCGCGAAVRLGLNPATHMLAASYFRYPRAEPAPGMVAVRRHHVFVIEAVLNGRDVLAYDANSGHHRTQLHVRSIAGYTVVNPHGRG